MYINLSRSGMVGLIYRQSSSSGPSPASLPVALGLPIAILAISEVVS